MDAIQARDRVRKEARELATLWRHVSRQHVGGAGCSCGFAGLSLPVSALEEDIVDFLRPEAERHESRRVRQLLDGSSARGSLLGWLDQLAAEPISLPDEDACRMVLDRLRLTLENLQPREQQQFACI